MHCSVASPASLRTLVLNMGTHTHTHAYTKAAAVKYLWSAAILLIINIYCDLLFCLGLFPLALFLSLPYPGDCRHQQLLVSVESLQLSLFEFLSFCIYCMPPVIAMFFPFLCFTIRLLMVFRCLCSFTLPVCFCLRYTHHSTSYPSSSTLEDMCIFD